MEYIHYGHSKFDPNRWNDVHGSEGGFFNKPDGGLWASPADAEYGWREWCMQECFLTDRLKKNFRFKLSPEARILELTPENVWELPVESALLKRLGEFCRNRDGLSQVHGIDFEKLAEDYDVLVCSISKYPDLYMLLYGWDCDSILVLNKDVIVVG